MFCIVISFSPCLSEIIIIIFFWQRSMHAKIKCGCGLNGKMEELKRQLCLQSLKPLGGVASGGCINNGQSYQADKGKIFVKSHESHKAEIMFKGEEASLNAILETKTLRVPKPLKVFANAGGKGWIFAMEHLDISGLRNQQLLGERLAQLHLYNSSLKTSASREYVDKFGFQCESCCGFIAMPNTWMKNWVNFYIENRLQVQVDLLEKEYRDQELKQLWPQLRSKIPRFFEGIVIEPALLHGDLWSGNVGETEEGPVAFDPASFYGHHEFDLGITAMFGGFSQQFYDAYHKLIPKSPGFASRHILYLLFHYLNHWNHFGTGYRAKSISLIKELL